MEEGGFTYHCSHSSNTMGVQIKLNLNVFVSFSDIVCFMCSYIITNNQAFIMLLFIIII